MDGGKAAQLNEQVEKLVELSHNFGELLLDVCGTMGVTLLTTRMVGKAFEKNLEIIWRFLEAGDVLKIGVHGMGGAGKTTLVKQINNRLVEQSQGGVFWVTASQEITIKSLQDKIVLSVGAKDLLDGDDEVMIRAAKLYKALSQKMKNSVLILDDVWENIDLMKVGCPISKECCRLIITTRSLEVCHQIGCQARIAVQKLDEDDAWKLFSETLSLGKEIKLGPQVEEIAKSVAKLCDGLPLAIIIVAGSMRGEKSIHTWRNTSVELKESVVGEFEVFKVLKYSFDRLNKPDEEFNLFQLCFLYCSLYPEDYEIRKKELVGKFISEGLLDQRKSRRAQFDQGYCILDKLVKVCLLESCVDYRRMKCVKMHDLVRGMALQIGGGKYMVRAGDESLKEIPMEEEWTEDLEKVSLMYNDIRIIQDGTSPNCPNLSTLLLHDNGDLEFIPDSFFTKMQGLCTLDLSGTLIKVLPNSISELKSLKTLFLENCEMLESVPYLGTLKALRELNLDYTAIEEVPQGVEELLNLKFLSIDAPHLEMLPQGLLLKLVRLQYVKFPFHVQVPVQEIENLKQVERFWGRVKNVRDFNRYAESRQIPMHGAFYKIQVGEELDPYFDEDTDYFGDYDRGLILSKCNLKDEKVLGQDIQCLTMSQCEGLSNCFMDDFSRLNYPSSLQKLIIESCGGTEYIWTSEQELPSQFSTLQLVELKDLKCLIKKREIEASPAPAPAQALFSSIRSLFIYKCNKMRKLGLPVLGFPNLEEITIERCFQIEEIFQDETLPKLRQLRLVWLPSLKSVFKATILAFSNLEEITIRYCSEMEEIFEDEGRADSLTLTLPKLQHLSLKELPRLKRVSKATFICNSIEEISILNCPLLMKKLPLHLELDDPPPPTLKYINVSRELWESLEWENPNLPTLLQPFLQFYSNDQL